MRISTRQSYDMALNSMLGQQGKLSETQLQISEGKRILKPSDDPIGSGIALNLRQQVTLSKQFNENGQSADHTLKVIESSLSSVTDILDRVRELTVQGLNGTLTYADRESIAIEMERRLEEMLGVGNTQIGDSKYLFSGFRTETRPFTQDIAGNITYNGDQGKHLVEVNTSVKVQTNLSGSEIFMEIPNGNGAFQTGASAGNTGTGVINAGNLSDPAAFNPESFTIDFVTNGSGALAYTVTDSGGAQVVPAPPAVVPADAPTFYEGADITFNGMQFQINGNPLPGDQFTVDPSSRQDVFTSIQQIIDAMRMATSTPELDAAMRNVLNNGLVNLDRAMEHVDINRSLIGARLNIVESERNINENVTFQAESTLSLVEDLDYAEAITRLNRQQVALQAAQQSFVQIQNLSLFRFLS